MFMRLFLILVLLLSACESTPKTKADPDAAPDTPAATSIDVDALLKSVVALRDREFTDATPSFVAVPHLKAEPVAGHSAYAADKTAILTSLFGLPSGPELVALPEREIARFDPQTNTINYVVSTDVIVLERALVFAIVEAIDHGQFAEFKPAQSWDEALAQSAAQHSMGSLVYVALKAGQRDVDLATVAQRPGAMVGITDVAGAFHSPDNSLVAQQGAFVRREGFTLAAAMTRAGGWSSTELIRIDPPTSAAYVVRPDRWLAGEDLGQWQWAESKWKATQEGRVGPAIAAMWLGQKIDTRIARSLYLSWQSDAYRFTQAGKNWEFEWISLWKSPHDAEQVAQALDAGLRTATHGSFVVVKKGVTVAVVGSSRPKVSDAQTLRGTQLAQSAVGFTPGEPKLVGFVPTPFDLYTRGVEAAELVFDLETQTWADPAAKLTLSLEALKGWKVQETESPTARWVASKPDGATILMNTELADPFLPKLGTDAYLNLLIDNFKKSVTSPKVKVQETLTSPALGVTHHLQLEGKVDDLPTVIELWMFAVDDTIVTLSLKAWPDTVDTARPVVESLFKAIEVERSVEPPKAQEGTIKFSVEN